MTSFPLALAAAVWAGAALGQIDFSPRQTPAPVAKHEVTGVVVNGATGEPVQRALVTLQTAGGQMAAFSDGSGHFALAADVPEGMYGLQCQKPGFAGPASNGFPFQQINVAGSATPVVIKLAPLAAISGRVVDEAGLPVDGITVQLLSEDIANGRKRWMPRQSVTSNEDGNYEISSLSPGSYRLRLNVHRAQPSATSRPLPRSRLPLNVYPSQYYPHSFDPSGAQDIVLQGGETENADFTVTAVPGFRLGGTVSPVQQGTFFQVQDSNGSDLGIGAGIDMRTRRFTVAGLSAGTWTLRARSFAADKQLWGEQTVHLEGADVMNLALTLEPLSSIPVELINAPEGGAAGVQLHLVRQADFTDEAGWNQNDYGAMSVQDPQHPEKPALLRFDNVLPGHYLLRAGPQGSTCVDSVRSGSSDVQREGLTLSAGEAVQAVQVYLRNDCASVQVKLNSSEGVATASILVASDDPTFEPPMINISGSAVSSFSGLTPGHYRLYAFDNANNLEYANPQAMSAFSAKELTLEPNEKAVVTLDVIKRSGERGNGDGAQ